MFCSQLVLLNIFVVFTATYYSFFLEDFLMSWGSEWVACITL